MLIITDKQIYRQTTIILKRIRYTLYSDKIRSFVLDLMITSLFITRVKQGLDTCL